MSPASSFAPAFAVHAIGLAFLQFVFITTGMTLQSCSIEIVDAQNGWPVLLVELRTTHNVWFVSDNAGKIAFDLPELMGLETWFFVEGHGYEVPADGFGYCGVRLTPEPGKKLTVKVNRRLPGKRLGRISGGGIFAESQKLGLEPAWTEQGVLGCDSVQTVVHNGKMFWAWGDTNLPHYPLGLFHMLGATTGLKPLQSIEPPIRMRFDYFRGDDGRPRVIAEMAGKGPTWLSGFASLPDILGTQRLVASYVKVQAPMTVYETGLCVWSETQEKFERHSVLWKKTEADPKPPPTPDGHPVYWTDESDKEWILFGDPFPHLKCPATFEAWSDPRQWQSLEPQKTVPVAGSGESIKPHRGSIAWNAWNKKWVCVFTQLGGKSSNIGEIWYADSDSPPGPWGNAVHVVTHADYSFYNPLIHLELTGDDSPVLLFEGTFTRTFSKNAEASPRHDYNQILYRLDLDDRVFSGDQSKR